MISNHYAFLTNAKHAWIVLIGLSLAGCLIRLYFVRKHMGHKNYGWWAGGLAIIAALFFWLQPAKIPTTQFSAPQKVGFADVKGIIETKCANCHMEKPTYPGFTSAPKNILLDTPERIAQHAPSIYQQTVVTKAMPIGNLTNITEDERAKVGAWFAAGAPSK
jgi:uncharacterized membrane protein